MRASTLTFDNPNSAHFLDSSKRQTVMRGLRIALSIVTFIWACLLVLVAIGFARGLSIPSEAAASTVGAPTLILYFATIVEGILVACILCGTLRSLRSLADCESPFSATMTKKTRVLSILLFSYGVVDSFIGTQFFAFAQVGASALGFSGPYLVAFDRPWWIPEINAGIFIAAAVVLAISLVFEYGCELQQESDAFL